MIKILGPDREKTVDKSDQICYNLNRKRKEKESKMTRETLIRDKKYIEKNAGNISTRRMLLLYERYLHGSDVYGLGVEYNNEAFIIFRKNIPLKYCSCQTSHGKTNNQYLRFRPHEWGALEIANARGKINLGSTEEMYKLYTCKNKKGYNSGYCCEKAVFNFYGIDGWVQDNKRADKGGDIELNGKKIQLKYVEKNSLATITSTKKILNQINRMLKATDK